MTKIQQEFKTPNYKVQTAMKLVSEKLILSSPNVQIGKMLPPAPAEMVKQFNVSNEIGQIILVMQHYVSVTSEIMKVHHQEGHI
jgi:hypothetical protein